MNVFASRLVENAVNELSRLPGIGKKTALRLALHLLKKDEHVAEALGTALIRMRKEIVFCSQCHNISDGEVCEICSSPGRDRSTLCVVEDVRDVMAIENTGQFNGLYHILGGIISPIDGVGPNDLHIDSLIKRVADEEVAEVILALSTTIEGDTTNFYLFKKLKDFNVPITTIARGVSVGDELEYADEVTLGRSLLNRQPYDGNLA